MSLADIETAAERLAKRIDRKIKVVDQGNNWAAVLIEDEEPAPEKGWKTMRLIANVNLDFPRTGPEPSGFYAQPMDFHNGKPVKSASAANLPNVGAVMRFSWSPKGYPQGDDLYPYYMWMRSRLHTPQEA